MAVATRRAAETITTRPRVKRTLVVYKGGFAAEVAEKSLRSHLSAETFEGLDDLGRPLRHFVFPQSAF